MKSKLEQTKIDPEAITGPRYWRSLDELVDKPEFKDFIEKEFPLGASELDGVNRRQFLKIMAINRTFFSLK